MKQSLIAVLAVICGIVAGGEIQLSSDWGQYHTSEQESVTFFVQAALPENPTEAIWAWSLSDIAGKKIAGSEKKCSATAGFQDSIAIRLNSPGYYLFETSVKSPSGISYAAKQLSIVRLAPSVADGKNVRFFGTCGHNAGEYADLVRKIGIRSWRADFDWGKVEPEEGKWNFQETDQLIDSLLSRDIECLAIIGYNPKWLKLEDGKPEDAEKFFRYVRTVVERYKDRIRCWDLWNEPQYSWNGDKLYFAELQKKACEIIKSIQPDAICLFNGHPFEEELRGYTREQLQHVGLRSFDVIGLHPYNRPNGPDDNDYLTHAIRIREWVDKNCPGTEVWCSELGWPTSTDQWGVGEMQQASYLVRSMLYSLAAGWKRYFQYMPFGGPNQQYSEHQYGFLAWGAGPKISLAAFAHTARTLQAADFVRVLDLGGVLQGLEFAVPDGSVICIWALHDPVIMTWEQPTSEAKLTAIDGSVLSREDKKTELRLSDNILFIETADADNWRHALEKGRVKLQEPIKIEQASIDDGKICIFLRSLDKVARQVNMQVTLPAGLTFANPGFQDKSQADISFHMAENLKEIRLKLNIPSGKILEGNATVIISGNDFKSSTNLPVKLIPAFYREDYIVDGKSGKWDRYPAIKLNSVFNVAPADLQLKWKGVSDLSVKRAHYGWNDRGVILYLEVMDENHVPLVEHISDWNMWRYDSVQFTLNSTAHMPPKSYDGFTTECGAGQKGEKSLFHRYVGASEETVEVVCRRDEAAKTTIYDILTPWRMFGVTSVPQPGFTFSASFVVNDNDQGEQGVRKFLELSQGIGVVKNPALYPRIRLE